MKKFLTKLSKYLLRRLKIHEKTVFLTIFLVLSFFIIKTLSDNYTISIPKKGGTLHEISVNNGESIHFINPIFAKNQGEKDLANLLYGTLLKTDDSGKIVDNLATLDRSEDGLSYTLSLKEAYFHDGSKLTSDDVIFTIESIKNPSLQSPLYPNWESVSIEKINEKEVRFTLSSKYNLFPNFLLIGILPKHLWDGFSPEQFKNTVLNLEPVGAGKYTFFSRNNTASEDTFHLKSNQYPSLISSAAEESTPYINNIIYHSFKTISDFEESSLYKNNLKIKNISSVYPSNIGLSDEYNPQRISIPKVTFLFLNLKDENLFLTSRGVRKAISEAISKDQIIDIALESNALLANSFRPWYDEETFPEDHDIKIARAKKLIEEAGWSENQEGFFEKNNKVATLEIDIIDSEEFKTISKAISKNLAEAGIKTIINQNELADYANKIVAQKDFQATIFGHDSYLNPDVYFFLSSEFENPINISSYNSPKANILSKTLRTTTDTDLISKTFEELEEHVFQNDIPMIPLYSPSFTYTTSKKMEFPEPQMLNSKEERFNSISRWYIDEEKILPFFKDI